MSLVYIVINPLIPGMCKIGKTDRTMHERLGELNRETSCPGNLEVYATHECDYSVNLEAYIHQSLNPHRQTNGLTENKNEWFLVTPELAFQYFDIMSDDPEIKSVAVALIEARLQSETLERKRLAFLDCAIGGGGHSECMIRMIEA